MIEKIKELITKSGLSQTAFLKEIGLPASAIAEWSKKKAKPSLNAIVKIADYFNVSVDYFLGRTNIKNINKREIKMSNIRDGAHFFRIFLSDDGINKTYIEIKN